MNKLLKSILVICLLVSSLAMTGCAKEEQPSASLIGVWLLTDMNGSDDAVQSMQYYDAMGMRVTMAISSDQLEMVTAVGDQTEYEVVGYRVEGSKLITDASEMEYTLNGNTLTLATGGVNMVFERR